MRRLFVLVLALAGCEAVKDAARAALGIEDAPEPRMDLELEESKEDAALDVPAVTVDPLHTGPLSKSDRKHPFPAKGGENMGFRLGTMAQVYALEAKVEAAPWSAPSSDDPALTRDDDIDTVWTCTATDETKCALGVHISTAATLKALRLYAPNVRRLRMHTDAGFIDALLPDTTSHTYAVLGQSVATQSLSIEVLELIDPKRSLVAIGELEVYGESGQAREGWSLDPARSFASTTKPLWRKRGRDTYEHGGSFVHVVGMSGERKRFIAGTALRGTVGDRLLLVERIVAQAGCDSPRGTFFLLDQQSRLVAPLGELGGAGGDLFRANDGNGLVIGYRDKTTTILDGVFIVDGKYERRNTPARPDKRDRDFFGEWGLQQDSVPRTAPLLDTWCVAADAATTAKLPAAKSKEPVSWRACDLGGGSKALMTDHGTCGKGWEVHVLDAGGTIVASASSKDAGAHLRGRRLADDSLLVEASSNIDAPSVLRVGPTEIERLAEPGALALPPPAACRSECGSGFPNPHAPRWR